VVAHVPFQSAGISAYGCRVCRDGHFNFFSLSPLISVNNALFDTEKLDMGPK
jgi:hypothetical protein